MTSTTPTKAIRQSKAHLDGSWRPNQKTLGMMARAGLSWTVTLSVPAATLSPAIAGAVIGTFAFLALENVFYDYHPRTFAQMAIGCAVSTAGTTYSFLQKGDLKIAWASWAAGLALTHLIPNRANRSRSSWF